MIRFLVTGQQLTLVTPIVVADTLNYQTAEAVFKGSAWESCSKWAHFIKDGEHYTVPFHDDAITAQQGLNLTAGTWQVYLHGNYYDAQTQTVTVRITSSTALLKVEAAELTQPFPPVTPELSEVLAAEVENALAVAAGVRQDAAAGAFNGATFTPMLSADGVLSFSNDKGLPNPAAVNVRGPAGDRGPSGVYIGDAMPTDPSVNVWVAPDGEYDYGRTVVEALGYQPAGATRKIADITLTEDGAVDITADMEGKAFTLNSVFVKIIRPVDGPTNYPTVSIRYYSGPNVFLSGGFNGVTITENAEYTGMSAVYSGLCLRSLGMSKDYIVGLYAVNNPVIAINVLRIFIVSALPAGTKILVYGG